MESKEENHEETGPSPTKKFKLDSLNKQIDSDVVNKQKFVKVCEAVSRNAYFDYVNRFEMLFLPNCSYDGTCIHTSKRKLQTINDKIQQIPPRLTCSILMEISGNMWYEALEIIFLSINSKQYLSSDILLNVVNIMLNAHEDTYSQYTIAYIIRKCEQILALHFCMHPPCCIHENIVTVYRDFLMGELPMTKKKHYIREYESDDNKGFVYYCFNRLEYEISSESEDGPLLNIDDIIPNKCKEGTKRLHYEKEELEIHELLNRTDRIDRLMAVLNSVIELLQFNLFIIKSRSIKTRQKPLIHTLFWNEENVVGKLAKKFEDTKILTQIMKLFAYFIHLNYPEEHVHTMSVWLKLAIETVYFNEINCNFDYPQDGYYVNSFSREFYTIISGLPHVSIFKILKRIQPNYMMFKVGLQYVRSVLKSEEDNIINVLIFFINNSQWKTFKKNNSTILQEELDPPMVSQKYILQHLSKIYNSVTNNNNNGNIYQKILFSNNKKGSITQEMIIKVLYIVLNAYLDAYSIRYVHAMLEKDVSENVNTESENLHTYQVTSRLINTYKKIYQLLQKLILVLNELKNDNRLTSNLKVFENIFKLELLDDK